MRSCCGPRSLVFDATADTTVVTQPGEAGCQGRHGTEERLSAKDVLDRPIDHAAANGKPASSPVLLQHKSGA